MKSVVDISSIAGVHTFYNYGKPRHPLITIVDLTERGRPQGTLEVLTD
jgi:hypothetical protein